MTSSAFKAHDHRNCIADGVASVERHCSEHKLKFTNVRRRVLQILLGEHKGWDRNRPSPIARWDFW